MTKLIKDIQKVCAEFPPAKSAKLVKILLDEYHGK